MNLLLTNKINKIVLGLFAMCLASFTAQCSFDRQNIDKNFENNIKTLCEQLRPPSDFKQFRSPRLFAKSDGGTYSFGYTSEATPDIVKKHYDDLLLPKEWKSYEKVSFDISGNGKTRYIYYVKDGYAVAIEFYDGDVSQIDRIYSITCSYGIR